MTYSQAMEALRNADESGNTEDAGKLAIIADRLKPILSNTVSADTIPSAPDIHAKPTEVDKNRFVEAISGGKSNNWEQFLFNNEIPADTTLGQLSQLIEGSGIQGLTGIGPIAETPALVTSIGQNIPSVAKTFPKVASAMSKVGEVASEIPSKVLASLSRRDPEKYKDVYNVGKEGIPSVVKEFRTAQAEEILPESLMNYNYARALGLPHKEALKVTHYRQDLENGAWKLWNEFKGQNPLGLPNFKDASLTQKEYIAGNAGQHLGDLVSPSKNAKQLLEGEGIIGGFGALTHSPLLMHALSNPLVASSIALQSPKLAAELAYRVGQASRAVPHIKKALPYVKETVKSLSVPQVAGAVSSANEELKKAKGGIIPMSLRDVHYHRLHHQRQG